MPKSLLEKGKEFTTARETGQVDQLTRAEPFPQSMNHFSVLCGTVNLLSFTISFNTLTPESYNLSFKNRINNENNSNRNGAGMS